MEEMKRIIARNITELRKKNGMTQLDLAEKLNYSDKAVSKWERGDSVPDIMVLKHIADLFSVTVDYLITEDHTAQDTQLPILQETEPPKKAHRFPFRVHAVITGMSILLVWLIATLIFFILWYTPLPSLLGKLLPFVFALPISCIVWLVFNTKWFNRRRNYLIISLMMWTILLSIWLLVLACGSNLWLIFTLGIPGQAIIGVWSGMWADMKKKLSDVTSSKDHSSKE